MIRAEVLAAARRLHWRCRTRLRDAAIGWSATPLHGRGLEFEEVRPYQVGDESRDIDWKVTARRTTLYVKRFVEERQTHVWLLLDETRSMDVPRFKRQAAIDALAVLALAAHQQDDRVGLITFGPDAFALPARSGRNHVLRLLAEALDPASRVTRIRARSLAEALGQLRSMTKGRLAVVLATDFLYETPLEPLGAVAKRHDLIVIHPIAAWERSLPNAGPIRVFDVETGRATWVDGTSPQVRIRFEDKAAQRERRIAVGVRKLGADYIAIREGQGGVDAVVRHFAQSRRLR